tara:strand:+ start:1379 stop:2704 length:1326 start_codon:yes stop_codon:yes gene_type:complete
MKLIYSVVILLFLNNCSFDNKTGIWNNANESFDEKNDLFKDFKTLSTNNSSFNKVVKIKENFQFKLAKPINNKNWKDIFFDSSNNYKNFNYNGFNQLVFKSKKLTGSIVNEFILFEKDNLIFSDQKGNIILYSVEENQIKRKFNFYKKKYKKIEKSLNIITDNNVIYVSDNLGYLYAYDYYKNKIIWAKNFKIPFNSNLKLHNEKIILSNQNNNLFFINKKNGETIKLIPTEENYINNQFNNNISLTNSAVFYLNNYGTLYSLDLESLKVKWFLNLNQSLDLNLSNLFFGSQLVLSNNKISVSSNHFTYIIDVNTGLVLYKINFVAKIKPIILDNYLFLISNNNLIISMDLKNGNIIYSYNINEKIAEFLKIKKDQVEFKNFFISNSSIYVFLKNSYLLIFNINGDLEKITKLPTKIYSQPIFVNGNMMYLTSNGSLSILN